MRVRIMGPNLNDQSRGTFHVHADGCADCSKYGPGRRFGGDVPGERETALDVASELEVVEAIYADQLDENPDVEAEDWLSDFYFAPCCSELPTFTPGTSPSDGAPAAIEPPANDEPGVETHVIAYSSAAALRGDFQLVELPIGASERKRNEIIRDRMGWSSMRGAMVEPIERFRERAEKSVELAESRLAARKRRGAAVYPDGAGGFSDLFELDVRIARETVAKLAMLSETPPVIEPPATTEKAVEHAAGRRFVSPPATTGQAIAGVIRRGDGGSAIRRAIERSTMPADDLDEIADSIEVELVPETTPLRETGAYQRILEDLAWLDRNVRDDPPLFAADFLGDVARELAKLVEAVSEGTI